MNLNIAYPPTDSTPVGGVHRLVSEYASPPLNQSNLWSPFLVSLPFPQKFRHSCIGQIIVNGVREARPEGAHRGSVSICPSTTECSTGREQGLGWGSERDNE
jgi:hypothetical protein